jgi:opacity protein-like surface antigen
MRNTHLLVAVVCLLAVPAIARAQSPRIPLKTEIEGFGGMTVGTAQFGSAVTPTFGGNVAVDLLPNLQGIGEFGRLNDISSPLFDLLEFTNVGVNVAAWYGEGGVRFLASPGVARPYGEATFGFARLNAGVTGLSGELDEYVNAALNIVNTTRPMLGVGGGVQLGRGNLVMDVGYRYKQITTGNTVASLLNLNKPYHINQVRIGVGVRF